MLARAAPIEDAVVYNGSPRYPAWCTVGERVTAKPSRGHPCHCVASRNKLLRITLATSTFLVSTQSIDSHGVRAFPTITMFWPK
ncbi:hypothetical protein O0I10_011423 [Lichtheimia ornata]|uniref:Uncharacterized protein n=1 Tax=Lichtheimia ornata TaxID=688661 RepID=A0AAD7UTI9_9FUNG|nr:uncharacterized protein O0I10_011423 [Lichtheimia ornata]KAJ8652960.1 hypothetical protein O0I10_011423 [Lichtheimia ornata]